MSKQRLAAAFRSAARGWARIKWVNGAIVITCTIGLPALAVAEPLNCGPRSELVKQLAKQFKEAPVAVGLADSGALVEVLTNGNGSTWTILVSQPNGTSCLVASGESWQALERVASGELDI